MKEKPDIKQETGLYQAFQVNLFTYVGHNVKMVIQIQVWRDREMRRRFNITGSCNPQRHYMVDLDDRLKRIKEDYVDEGEYFVINKGRQYGKTTVLRALHKCLMEDYIVISLDFQQMGTEDFADAAIFVRAFVRSVLEILHIMGFKNGDDFIQSLTVK